MKKNSPKNETGRKFSFDSLIEIALLVAVFLTPVIFDRRLGIVFSGTKVAWLRAFIIVILSLWAIKLIVTGRHRFSRTALDWPVLSFLLTTTIATLTSVHVYTSFVGFYGRFEGLSTWYLFGLLFFIVTNYVRSPAQLKRIIAVVVPAATLMSVYGVIQRHELDPYMWGGVITWQRVIGTIGQPNFLAAYVIMAFFLGLTLLLEEKEAPKEIDWNLQYAPLSYFFISQVGFIMMIYTLEASNVILWYAGFALVSTAVLLFAFNYDKLHPLVIDLLTGGCLVLIYVCLLYTQSRGGYMGFLTGAVVFALVAGRGLIFKRWRELLALGAVITAVSAFTMLRPEFSPFERFTSEITTKQEIAVPGEAESKLELKGAAGSRGETWKSGFKIIADNPVFGIGPEVLKMIFPRYETELFRFKEAFHVKQDRNHNETFDVPVTKGLLSFFLYLWIIFTVFASAIGKLKTASPSQRLMLAGLLGAIMAYLIQNQFSFGVVAITSLLWVMWGMVMAVERGEEEQEKEEKFLIGDIPWIPVALVVMISLPLFYLSFLSFRADVLFKSGKTNLEARRAPEAIEDLKRSLSVLPFEGTTVSHLGIAFLNTGNAGEALKILTYGTAVDPYNADNYFMLARLVPENSEKYVEITLKIDPYYAEAYELKGALFEKKGMLPEAFGMYLKAFSVNPTLGGPIQKIIELSRRLGRVAEARMLFDAAARKMPDDIGIFKARENLK